MHLKFLAGGELATRVVQREHYVSPPEFEPAPEVFRKTNVRGEALRRRVLALLRRRGDVTLGTLAKRFGMAPVVAALLVLAEGGLIDVLNHDRFRAKGAS